MSNFQDPFLSSFQNPFLCFPIRLIQFLTVFCLFLQVYSQFVCFSFKDQFTQIISSFSQVSQIVLMLLFSYFPPTWSIQCNWIFLDQLNFKSGIERCSVGLYASPPCPLVSLIISRHFLYVLLITLPKTLRKFLARVQFICMDSWMQMRLCHTYQLIDFLKTHSYTCKQTGSQGILFEKHRLDD